MVVWQPTTLAIKERCWPCSCVFLLIICILLSTYIYIYFYPRTLSALPDDCLPTLEPGTRYRISGFMAPRHETPRDRRGDAPRAGGHSPRPSGDVCAKPLRLEHYLDARGVPSSGAGPSQNRACLGICIGSTILAGRRTVNIFPFGRTRVYIRQSDFTE